MEMVESLSRGLLSQRASRWLSLALSVLLGMLLVVLFARSARIATGNPPSFDGAMNLQVAASLAKGDGYRRDYAEHPIFPHEIQTGPPYILPAAAVFKLWGVGIPQAEVVNLVYLALLLAITCWLIAPMGGWPLALFGACTVVTVPGVHLFGFMALGKYRPSLGDWRQPWCISTEEAKLGGDLSQASCSHSRSTQKLSC